MPILAEQVTGLTESLPWVIIANRPHPVLEPGLT